MKFLLIFLFILCFLTVKAQQGSIVPKTIEYSKNRSFAVTYHFDSTWTSVPILVYDTLPDGLVRMTKVAELIDGKTWVIKDTMKTIQILYDRQK